MPGDKTDKITDKIFPKVRLTEIPLLDRLLLIGPPGIGKTMYIKELAKREAERLGRVFVDLREVTNESISDIIQHPESYYVFLRVVAPHVLPEDISIPRIVDDNYVEFIPPRILRILTLKNIAGVVFVDELSNIQRDDQLTMFFSLILEKEVAWNVKFSDKVKIVAAANDSMWSEVARSLPRPLRNRLIIIHVEPPSIENWIEYMNQEYGENWDRIVGAYLMLYPEDFIRAPPQEEDDGFTAFPTPRAWSTLALTLKQLESQQENIREAIIYGTVGPEVAPKLVSLLKDAVKLPEIIERLKREPTYFKELTVTEKILVIHYLASHYDEYINIISHLEDEYLIMLIMLIPPQGRLKFLAHNRDIAKKVAHRIASIQ